MRRTEYYRNSIVKVIPNLKSSSLRGYRFVVLGILPLRIMNLLFILFFPFYFLFSCLFAACFSATGDGPLQSLCFGSMEFAEVEVCVE